VANKSTALSGSHIQASGLAGGMVTILNLPLDTIPLNLGSSRYHKIQNPALHPFGVAGFWVTIDHFKSSILIGLKEETWFRNITECCLYLTHLKVNGNSVR
jgi:hypothetical protein